MTPHTIYIIESDVPATRRVILDALSMPQAVESASKAGWTGKIRRVTAPVEVIEALALVALEYMPEAAADIHTRVDSHRVSRGLKAAGVPHKLCKRDGGRGVYLWPEALAHWVERTAGRYGA